jgi:hypothetical protein
MLDNKKGQVSGGLITMIVFGIASLVIGVIIAFVITQTLSSASLLTSGRTTTTVTNETGASANSTGYTLAQVAGNRQTYTATTVWAAQGGEYNITVPLANVSVSAAGVVTNGTAIEYSNISISYTYVTLSSEETSTSRLTNNFTSGVDNVSLQIPTVLLVAAIVLIIGVLAILVAVWQRMKMSGQL